jgi:hypothetical protein
MEAKVKYAVYLYSVFNRQCSYPELVSSRQGKLKQLLVGKIVFGIGPILVIDKVDFP